MDIPENDRRVLKLGRREVIIDTENLKYNEVTLGSFFQKAPSWYDNIGRGMADAEALVQSRKMEFDRIYGERFDHYKTDGKISDKLAGARTDGDEDVMDARKKLVAAQQTVSLIKNHLRAWDKAFECAQSTGHMLRKEMDKLGHDLRVERSVEDALGE
tara:strand:+ start:56 stop:529 length:474 start_codon:yes stop_codon:yes gene_type:complete